MDDSAKRLIQARERAGYTRAADAAAAMGVAAATYHGHENGSRGLGRSAQRYADFFGVSLDWLLRGKGEPPSGEAKPAPETPAEPPLPPGEDLIPAPMISRHDMPADVPVYGTAVGGAVGDFQLNGQLVDYIRRPPALRSARNAFAIFYANDSMYPAFEAGDPLYVNPAIPPRAGDYIIIEMHPARDGTPGAAYVKRLVRKTEKTLICSQYNPARDDLKFEMAKIKAIWRVVPTRELLGV